MSMFLAPIHFMVYGKNQLQEQLIARIAERAAAEGWATAEALDAVRPSGAPLCARGSGV